MLWNQPILHLARVTVEAVSPLSIGTGRGSALFDVQLATDANGLPTIPGTSLAGVLRHALFEQHEKDAAKTITKDIFGFADGNEGQPSAFSVTWGHIHNSEDTPVDGVDLDRAWANDDILKLFALPALPHRDHVRLNHRGSAAERGKFDRSFVPAGYRFSFDMSLAASADKPLDEEWAQLLALLNSFGFRLGGSSRRGYGQLKLIRIAARRFDLTKLEDFNAYCAHPRQLNEPHALGECALPKPARKAWLRHKVQLTPEDGWRFGGGKEPLSAGKTADALPYSEERLAWVDGKVHSQRFIVVPASGIKGALAHRLAYHYNRRKGHFADTVPADFDPDKNQGVQALFGYANAAGDGGQVGAVLIEDALLPMTPPAIRLTHNSIDRFTGGVRHGVLFTEEVLFGGSFPLRLAVKSAVWNQLENPIRLAFLDTMEDLAEGRLALGAASAKGHGYFSGTVETDELRENVE